MQTNAVAIDPTVENMKKRNQTSTAVTASVPTCVIQAQECLHFSL